MNRVLCLIIICAFASTIGASQTFAQSGRFKRAEPSKDERAEKSETKDEAKDAAKDKPQGEAQANGDKQTLTGKEVTVRARIKSKPQPIYPYGARRRGVQGEVKLRIILGSDGRVRDEMEVLEGLPYGVTDEAIKAARQIKFEPARKDGRPVSQYVTVIYHFNIY